MITSEYYGFRLNVWGCLPFFSYFPNLLGCSGLFQLWYTLGCFWVHFPCDTIHFFHMFADMECKCCIVLAKVRSLGRVSTCFCEQCAWMLLECSLNRYRIVCMACTTYYKSFWIMLYSTTYSRNKIQQTHSPIKISIKSQGILIQIYE